MGKQGQQAVRLCPSPWPSVKPTLYNPFIINKAQSSPNRARSDSDCFSCSSSPFTSSTTTSPGCSPQSSPTSERPAHSSRFGRYSNRQGNSKLRRISSTFFSRRRPSSVDVALSEERLRCAEDEIERIGLEMMEPRPVDPIPTGLDVLLDKLRSENTENRIGIRDKVNGFGALVSPPHQPRFVMGGIFEIMEEAT
ncbi:hypothetical protein VTO42DRAFT_3393 [Malbranchea cinnamomea]